MSLTLDTARTLVDEALKAARGRVAQPLAVIVLDSGGHPVAYAREDGASLFRFDLARAKAMGALGFGADTRELAVRAAANPTFFNSAAVATQGAVAFSAGGVLIRGQGGELLGAVGVSGDAPDVDEACAIAGVEAAGLSHGGGR